MISCDVVFCFSLYQWSVWRLLYVSSSTLWQGKARSRNYVIQFSNKFNGSAATLKMKEKNTSKVNFGKDHPFQC